MKIFNAPVLACINNVPRFGDVLSSKEFSQSTLVVLSTSLSLMKICVIEANVALLYRIIPVPGLESVVLVLKL